MDKTNIKQIILTCHPLREYGGYGSACQSTQLAYYLETVTNLPVQIVVPPSFCAINMDERFIPFDYVKFFQFYGKTYNRTTWGEFFYKEDYNEEAYEYVKSIFQDSLVIGYEVEWCIQQMFEYYGIPYVDMYISPIRFLDDQLYSITSNNEEIYNKLLNYKLPEEKIYMQANYLKTYYLMKDWQKMQSEPAVLFLGQTPFDRSLINTKTGEIYSILNHKEEFRKAISGYKRILYKRHPKASGDTAILEYIKTLADVSIVNENFYAMISRHDIKKVVAISSGGLIEAKYFGKETEHLLHSSVNLQDGTNFDREKYINVYEHFYSLHFWADILSPLIKTKDFPSDYGFYGQKNKLRNSRGHRDYWGYQDIDHEMIKEEFNNLEYKSTNSLMMKKLFGLLYHTTYNKTFFKLYKSFS